MTRKVHHRRKLQYAFGTLVGLVVAAVLVFVLVFYLPARREYTDLEAATLELRAGIVQRQAQLDRLEDAEHRLSSAREGRELFLSSSLVSREMGYSALLPDLVDMARRAGIERPGASYQISDDPIYGVYPVEVLQPIRGSYPAVRRFIEELETSPRFFLIDSISMAQSGSDVGGLEVDLMMSTFFADYHE